MREWLWVAIVGPAMTLIPGMTYAQSPVPVPVTVPTRATAPAPVTVPVAVPARAPAPATVATGMIRANDYFDAPGLYGTSYGVASYRVPRTYSEFASPFGVGYGYGYPPSGFIPNRYGVGLWRPGVVAPGYVAGASPYQTVYGASPYLTWAVPSLAGSTTPLPSIGVYAPAFGSTGPMKW